MLYVLILPLAFVCELVDSTLGMGYGTTLTPVLLLMGFEPLQVVPAVLLSELFTGFTAALTHHKFGNVNLDFKNDKQGLVTSRLKKIGYLPKSKDAKIALVLALTSVIGGVISVLVVVNLSKVAVKTTIGGIVLIMGLIILINANKIFKFSWLKIVGLGTVAAFNKGISGGGYGPLICGGQILSGVRGKSAIAITSFSEAVASLVGVAMYFFIEKNVDWKLAPYLIIGAMLSVPVSGYLVKKLKMNKLTLIIGIVTVILGGWTLYNVFF